MKEKTKNLLIAVLIIGLVSMTVAYAALTQVLNINAGAKVINKASSWNVHFTNLSAADLDGYATIPTNKGLVLSGTTTLTGLEVNLRAPGDAVTYTFDVVNEGTINAKVSQVVLPTVAGATYAGASADVTIVKANLEYSLTHADGTAITQNETLNAGTTKSLKLKISYKSSATNLPAADVTVSGLNAHIDYVQN